MRRFLTAKYSRIWRIMSTFACCRRRQQCICWYIILIWCAFCIYSLHVCHQLPIQRTFIPFIHICMGHRHRKLSDYSRRDSCALIWPFANPLMHKLAVFVPMCRYVCTMCMVVTIWWQSIDVFFSNHLLDRRVHRPSEQLLNQLFRFGGRVRTAVCVCRLCVVYTPHYLYIQ